MSDYYPLYSLWVLINGEREIIMTHWNIEIFLDLVQWFLRVSASGTVFTINGYPPRKVFEKPNGA
jgi:hypothetical protein